MSTPTRAAALPLTRFWLSLERVPGLAAVTAHWRALLHDDFDRVSHLLAPEPALAGWYPRLDGRGPGYAVVEHGPDDFAAAALGLTPDPAAVADLFGVVQAGWDRPAAGHAFPAFLAAGHEYPAFKAAAEALVALVRGPFLLLAPTPHHLRLSTRQALEGARAAFVPLADGIGLAADGRWAATDAARARLGAFRARAVPRPASEGPPPKSFPTPDSAAWSDVQMRFVDGHRVSVRVRGAGGTFNYAQVGMADGRNGGEPTKQWELLRAFARGRGRLTWGSPSADRRNQKRRETLARNLRDFFGLGGDPIVLTAEGDGWQTVFAVEPEP